MIVSWKQMACASEQRWANERQAYRLTKRYDYKEIRAEKGHIFCYCKICLESKANEDRGVIAHQHHSTMLERCSSGPDPYGQFECKNCEDKKHYAVQASRYPLLVTSSFLNGWREPYLEGQNRYEGDKIHLDEICIPGGKIEHLHHAFMSEYMNSRPEQFQERHP